MLLRRVAAEAAACGRATVRGWRAAGGHLVTVAAAVALTSVVATGEVSADEHVAEPLQPLSLDDLFNVESFGTAAFSPDSAQLAYERGASRQERPSSAYGSTLHNQSVQLIDLRSGVQAQIAGSDPAWRYSLDTARLGAPFSPDGRYLALYARGPVRAGFAVFDTRTQALRALPGEPRNFFPAGGWTADGRLIYAAAAPGEGLATNFQFLDRVSERWSATWNATAPQVSVTSASPLVPGDRKAAGTLRIARALDGAASEISSGDYTRVAVSPDGRRVATVRRGAPVSHRTYDAATGELQVFGLTADGARLEAAFPQFDVAWQWLEWSPDSRRLLVGGRALAAGASPAHLLVYDTRAGSLRDAGLEGATLDFLSGLTGFGVGQVGWIAGTPLAIASRFVGVDAAPASPTGVGQPAGMRADLWAVTARGPRNLTSFARSPIKAFADPMGYGAAFVVADGALWRVAPDRDAQRLTPPDGVRVLDFALPDYSLAPARSAFSPHGAAQQSVALRVRRDGRSERVVFDLAARSFGAARSAGRLLARSRATGLDMVASERGRALSLVLEGRDGARELEHANAFLDQRAAGELVALDYAVDGANLRSWLVLPPGRGAAERVPAVAYVYGGTHWVEGDVPPDSARLDHQTPFANGQLMAARGYAMLYPALPSQPGSDVDVQELIAKQTVAAVDAAAARGLIDPARVAVMGHSFGGFSTAAILARRSDRFRAGIALAGVYNYFTAYGARDLRRSLSADPSFWSGSMDYIETIQIRLGAPPWTSPAAYIRNSPLFSVERMDAPLMMIQGDLDYDVTSLYGAEQMYAALVRAGKKPVLLRYWGEGHTAQSVPNIRDQWQRIAAWLDAHLGK